MTPTTELHFLQRTFWTAFSLTAFLMAMSVRIDRILVKKYHRIELQTGPLESVFIDFYNNRSWYYASEYNWFDHCGWIGGDPYHSSFSKAPEINLYLYAPPIMNSPPPSFTFLYGRIKYQSLIWYRGYLAVF